MLVELAGVAVVPDEGESVAYLTLEADGSRLAGSGGCNRLTGSFDLSHEGLRFGPVAATRMACADPVMRMEGAFLRALAATTRSKQDGSLLVLFEGDRALARLTASID